MKKTLIAAAVMGASGIAFAASNVTLYGEFSHARERCSQRCERLKNLVVH